MSSSVRFSKVCTTCGRSLQIPVELLGKEICCQGCGARLLATTPETSKLVNSFEGIDERVDRLIQAADRQLQHASTPSHQH